MRTHEIKFNDGEIASWLYEGKEPSVYTFCETLALAGLEGKGIRLSAGMQRRLLGYPVMGKLVFKVGQDGTVRTWCSQCFGTDFETMSFPSVYFGVAARRGEKIHPKYSGKGYFSIYAYEREEQSS
jgi:hypothetical protein